MSTETELSSLVSDDLQHGVIINDSGGGHGLLWYKHKGFYGILVHLRRDALVSLCGYTVFSSSSTFSWFLLIVELMKAGFR